MNSWKMFDVSQFILLMNLLILFVNLNLWMNLLILFVLKLPHLFQWKPPQFDSCLFFEIVILIFDSFLPFCNHKLFQAFFLIFSSADQESANFWGSLIPFTEKFRDENLGYKMCSLLLNCPLLLDLFNGLIVCVYIYVCLCIHNIKYNILHIYSIKDNKTLLIHPDTANTGKTLADVTSVVLSLILYFILIRHTHKPQHHNRNTTISNKII